MFRGRKRGIQLKFCSFFLLLSLLRSFNTRLTGFSPSREQPGYHGHKPIIVGVDDRLESPETLTLRYEEAARAASGGDPRGDSSPRLLDMAAYGKAQLPSMDSESALSVSLSLCVCV